MTRREAAAATMREVVAALEAADREREQALPPWVIPGMQLWSGHTYYVTALSFDALRAKVSYTAMSRGPLVLAQTRLARDSPACKSFVEQGLAGLVLGVEAPIEFVPVTAAPGTAETRFGSVVIPGKEKPLLLKGHAVYRYIRERLKENPAAGGREIAVGILSLEGWEHE